MGKRAREADEEAAAPAPTAACEFCGRSFKARGLKTHQRSCPERREAGKRPRKSRFCVPNEHVLDGILGFLSNQSMTKLQLATGDRFAACESRLSRYCCPCEDDKPAIRAGLCTDCEAQTPDFKPRVTTTEARALYGVHDLSGVPGEFRRRFSRFDRSYTLFNRVDLDAHMLKLFGSRRGWLRAIAAHKERAKKRAATKQQRLGEYKAFLETLPPAFVPYVKTMGIHVKDTAVLAECHTRYEALVAPLKERRLELRTDSRLCEAYIKSGVGKIPAIVNTMEEMAFLFAHTDYSARCRAEIESFREYQDEWYSEDDYTESLQSCRERVKMDLCVEYLLDSKSLTLPRKWEACRARLERVRATGKSPKARAQHIYAAAA